MYWSLYDVDLNSFFKEDNIKRSLLYVAHHFLKSHKNWINFSSQADNYNDLCRNCFSFLEQISIRCPAEFGRFITRSAPAVFSIQHCWTSQLYYPTVLHKHRMPSQFTVVYNPTVFSFRSDIALFGFTVVHLRQLYKYGLTSQTWFSLGLPAWAMAVRRSLS